MKEQERTEGRIYDKLARAAGYLSRVETRGRDDHDRLVFAQNQILAALDDLRAGSDWRSLPAEPGPEVVAIRCPCHGIWTVEAPGWWQLAKPRLASMGPYRVRWAELYRGCAPLSDATPTEDASDD